MGDVKSAVFFVYFCFFGYRDVTVRHGKKSLTSRRSLLVWYWLR